MREIEGEKLGKKEGEKGRENFWKMVARKEGGCKEIKEMGKD